MGDVFFIHAFRGWRDPEDANKMRKPEIVTIRSENLQAFLELNGNRTLSTTFGIWMYEGNLLYGRAQLKKDLLALIKLIDGIKI